MPQLNVSKNPYEMTDDEYIEYLRKEYQFVVLLPDREWVGLSRMIFTCAILRGHLDDRAGHSDRWCYDNVSNAALYLGMWVGGKCKDEPAGWHRHPDSGRRRPGGRKDLEHVDP